MKKIISHYEHNSSFSDPYQPIFLSEFCERCLPQIQQGFGYYGVDLSYDPMPQKTILKATGFMRGTLNATAADLTETLGIRFVYETPTVARLFLGMDPQIIGEGCLGKAATDLCFTGKVQGFYFHPDKPIETFLMDLGFVKSVTPDAITFNGPSDKKIVFYGPIDETGSSKGATEFTNMTIHQLLRMGLGTTIKKPETLRRMFSVQ